eukprot:TRINITY_DN11900_c0_g1_i2.p1 TRINITY_DN11900_c0_g1~~TRINITY_DN11900_c0_g1_i2.p1  ORF type:complete len:492 (+),score=116.54 TRINITY_DN11900_c0_g1_i2:76-1551(+)
MGGGFKKKRSDEETRPLLPKDLQLQFKVLTPIALRHQPKLDADRTGSILEEGDIITTHDIILVDGEEATRMDYVAPEGDVFIDIGGGRGWAIARHPATDEDLLKPVLRDDEGGFRFHVRQFFLGKDYDFSIAALILANAVVIWYEIDYPKYAPIMYAIANNYFCMLYVIEILSRIYAFGPQVFFGSYWNIFDFTVTLITVVSDWLIYFFHGDDAEKLRRVAPTLRLLRVLRLTNMFQGLRSLMHSFTQSVLSLTWIAVFIAIWFFICACLTTVFIGQKEFFPDTAVATPEQAAKLRFQFHSVTYSMYTLWEVMTMDGWMEVVQPLVKTQPFLLMFFFVFAFVAGFFLMNLVTAVVVDRAMKAQEFEHAASATAQEDDREVDIYRFIEKLKELTGGKDSPTRDAISKALPDEELREHMMKISWDGALVEAWCSVMDKQKDGKICLYELRRDIASSGKEARSMTLIRMQADLSVRIEKRQSLLDQLFRKAGLS